VAVRVEARRPRRSHGSPAAVRPPVPRARPVGLLLGLVAMLNVVGLVMVLSASSVHALRAYGSAWLFFERQLLWVAIGTALLVVTMRIDYRVWRRLVLPLLAVTVGLLLLVLVPGMGISVGGSARWLGFGMLRIQPSELAKLTVAVSAADVLTRRADHMRSARLTVVPVLLVFALIALLVLVQPDLGTTLVLACVVLAVLFVAGVPLPTMGAIASVAGGATLLAGTTRGYRRGRLLCFLHPGSDPGNACYQLRQSLVGLGSGHVTGVGLGASRAKWGFLPNAHTDFIFAIIGEELGLVGSLLVAGLFVAFAVAGVRAASRAPDRFGTLLAAGITAWIVGQAFINIGAAIGTLPITGVPLPFVSFGGSSLVIAMAATGILVNIARQARPASV
jgi:cell division protein FtsW